MSILTIAVYADVPEYGRKKVTDVRSGMFMIVNLSSAVIKEYPTLTCEAKLVLLGKILTHFHPWKTR